MLALAGQYFEPDAHVRFAHCMDLQVSYYWALTTLTTIGYGGEYHDIFENLHGRHNSTSLARCPPRAHTVGQPDESVSDNPCSHPQFQPKARNGSQLQ